VVAQVKRCHPIVMLLWALEDSSSVSVNDIVFTALLSNNHTFKKPKFDESFMFAAQCRISYVSQFNTYKVRNLHSKSMSKSKVMVMLLINLGYSKDESNQNFKKVKLYSLYYSTLLVFFFLLLLLN